MNQEKIGEAKNNIWVASAVAAPLIHAASGCSWLAAAGVSALVLVTVRCTKQYLEPSGTAIVFLQKLWICLLIAEIMKWSGSYWPGHQNERAAPVILLILTVWAAWKSENQAAGIGAVLLWPILALAGAVLLSAGRDLKWDQLKPGFQMNSAHLITLLIIFVSTKAETWGRKNQVFTVCAAALVAAATAGVLTLAVSAGHDAPFYELSRSLSLFGAVERFESLAAAAMTLGYFASISYLLCKVGKGWKMLPYAGLSMVIYMAEKSVESRTLAVGSILLWIMLPTLGSLKKILKKRKKGY